MNKINPSLKPEINNYLSHSKSSPNPFPSFYHSEIIAKHLAEYYAYEECGCKENPGQTNINWPYHNKNKLDKIEGKYKIILPVVVNIDLIGPITIGPRSILNITSPDHPLYSEIEELYKQDKIKKL